MQSLTSNGRGASPVVSVRISEDERDAYVRHVPNGNLSAFMRASAVYLFDDWARCRRRISKYFRAYLPFGDGKMLQAVDWNWVAARLFAAIVGGEATGYAVIPARNRDWVWCAWCKYGKTITTVAWGAVPHLHATFSGSVSAHLRASPESVAKCDFVLALINASDACEQVHKVGSRESA